MLTCTVCGNNEFRDQKVLWPDLVDAWEISDLEVAYVDRQQGTVCTTCGTNLRGIALCNAIRDTFETADMLGEYVRRHDKHAFKLLDLNGTPVSEILSVLPGYTRADYPQIDMQEMPFPEGMFDLVIHSDTLEHIEHPVTALRECKRILKHGGVVCYTIPMIVERLSRRRTGLRPSFHGNSSLSLTDYLVYTEYGADAWQQPILAGFESVTIHTVDYPAATAFKLRKRSAS